MQSTSRKATILSAKDSVKSATDKLTKIAQDMETSEVAMTPEQVKEIAESISAIGQEIVQQAETVAENVPAESGEPEPVAEPVKDTAPVAGTLDEETQKKLDAQEEELDELKKFKESSEKEKLATEYARLFPVNQQSAKLAEFMKMDKPNSELSTIVSATESALSSLTKNASMRKTNETIIFQHNQKNASMGTLGAAKSLSEI